MSPEPNGNGTRIFPPVVVRGKEYKPGRILRFLVGLAVVFHAVVWGPYADLAVMGIKIAVGLLLVDPKLLAAWKSRNG